SPQSDLYALGVMLYEIVAGRPPFIVTTAAALLDHHRATPVTSPRTYNEQLPLVLDNFILRLLSKDPATRPTSVKDLQVLLAHVIPTPPSPFAPPPLPASALEPTPPTRSQFTTLQIPNPLHPKPPPLTAQFVGRISDLARYEAQLAHQHL